MRRFAAQLLYIFIFTFSAHHVCAQAKVYKFDKGFIDQTLAQDSAMGTLRSQAAYPAGQIHTISCGGADGELHIGIAPKNIGQAGSTQTISGPASTNESFGIVAEPPNASRSLLKQLTAAAGTPIAFFGYIRVWNEGHDVGTVYPSNPHHVLEVHPVWGIRANTGGTLDPQTIFPMQAYQGYGSAKYKALLKTISDGVWPKVAEDNEFVYVSLLRADNFYQLPVSIKAVKPVSQGVEATVDVLADLGETEVIYRNLSVIAATGSEIATQLAPGQTVYLLGFFSINLRKAMTAASGHQSPSDAVSAPEALEFFAFGFPKEPAVSSCASTEH